MSSISDYYAILGVSSDAEDIVITGARNALLKKYHPEKYQDKQQKEIAEKKSKDINDAYDVLHDPQNVLHMISNEEHPHGVRIPESRITRRQDQRQVVLAPNLPMVKNFDRQVI